MDEGFSKSIISKIGFAILVIALVDLFFLNWSVFKSEKLKADPPAGEAGSGKSTEDRAITDIQSPPPSPLDIASPSPTSAPDTSTGAGTQTIVEEKTVVQTAQKEIFIPIGSGSIKKKDWGDIPGLEVTIDTTKYSDIESIVFEATIWPEGGNGRAYARLKNISDSNPLIESQISSASTTGELKTSGNIPFPGGSRKYGVQSKTDIENFAAHVENARIKINLK